MKLMRYWACWKRLSDSILAQIKSEPEHNLEKKCTKSSLSTYTDSHFTLVAKTLKALSYALIIAKRDSNPQLNEEMLLISTTHENPLEIAM